MKKNNKLNLKKKHPWFQSTLVTTKANCVTSGVVIWFYRKIAWRKLWSCRSLNFIFRTHFCIGTKQRNRLGLFVDCGCQNLQWFSRWGHCFVSLDYWSTAHIALLNDANCCGFLVYDGQRIHRQNKLNV